MKLAFALLAAGSATALALLTEPQQQFLFTTFVQQFDKQYETKEVLTKFAVFKSNLDTILKHNTNPTRTFTMAVNSFADLTSKEYRARLTLRVPEDVPSSVRVAAAPSTRVPADASIDWEKEGIIGPVRDQQMCGSCWSFSAIGALEPLVTRKTGKLVDLSEQQLVDCSRGQGNMGCMGGLMNNAYDYIKAIGSMSEADYPYTAKDGECKEAKDKAVVTLKDYTAVAPTAEALENAVMKQPVAIALSASSAAFQFYSSGVIKSEDCTPDLNHGVVLVGLGSEEAPASANEGTGARDSNQLLYYRVRNSWSASWGDKGYIKIERGTNTCGVENHNWNMLPGEVEVKK